MKNEFFNKLANLFSANNGLSSPPPIENLEIGDDAYIESLIAPSEDVKLGLLSSRCDTSLFK